MANKLYGKARQKFLANETNGATSTSGSSISWINDTIKVMLIDTSNYTDPTSNGNIDVHEFLNSVPSAARIGTAQTLSSKTATLGVADAAGVTFPSVTPAGTTIEAVIIYKDTGTETTSPLIAWIDTATGLPVTANGGNINLAFDTGANRIFKL